MSLTLLGFRLASGSVRSLGTIFGVRPSWWRGGLRRFGFFVLLGFLTHRGFPYIRCASYAGRDPMLGNGFASRCSPDDRIHPHRFTVLVWTGDHLRLALSRKCSHRSWHNYSPMAGIALFEFAPAGRKSALIGHIPRSLFPLLIPWSAYNFHWGAALRTST